MSDTTDVTTDTTQTPVVFADATGRITQCFWMPRWMVDIQTAPAGGSVVISDGHWETDFVKEGAVVARPANPTTLEGMMLKNVPAPCMVTVEGVDHACTDTTVELSFSHPGTYTVKVDAWPMLDATFEVTQA
jgi:hypothetical protein